MSYVTKEMLESFAEHKLICEYETGAFSVYRLVRLGTRVMSVQLSFSPEGTAIQGDLTPERNGSVSVFGCGQDWFTLQTPEGYLCEKFLTEKWLPSIAVAELLDSDGPWLVDRDTEQQEHIKDLSLAVDGGDVGVEEFRTSLTEVCGDLYDELPGYRYDPDEAGWLCAIQQTFRRLYWARMEKLAVLSFRAEEDEGEEVDIENLPELTDKERAALDSLGPDFITKMIAKAKEGES